MTDRPDRGQGTVSFAEMRRGGVGLCVATLIARYVALGNPLPGWHSQDQAWAHDAGAACLVPRDGGARRDRGDSPASRRSTVHIARWDGADGEPLGCRLRAQPGGGRLDRDPRTPRAGLRAGAAGRRPGALRSGRLRATGRARPAISVGAGRELLREMERLGIILDATHLCDDSFCDALDHFHGPVWASHSNCRTLVPRDRQFTDDQIRELVARGAVIGAAFDAWMLVPGWVRGRSTPAAAGVSLETVADHIDHVCQIAGNARHAGIGSDLDGAFGREQCPQDVETIADLARLPAILQRRGYSSADVEAIAGGNIIRFLRDSWA